MTQLAVQTLVETEPEVGWAEDVRPSLVATSVAGTAVVVVVVVVAVEAAVDVVVVHVAVGSVVGSCLQARNQCQYLDAVSRLGNRRKRRVRRHQEGNPGIERPP